MKSISGWTILILAIVSALSLGSYLLVSNYYYRTGFPLDDAWIHQTYARNLAIHGEWAYVSGELSGGSTSPLWSAILAFGYLLRITPFVWTFLLGWLSLWALSILGVQFFLELSTAGENYAIWIGLLLTLEWHILWMAGSGMETLLFVLLVTFVLSVLIRKENARARWLIVGGCIGLSTWLRPDGITLLGPVMMIVLLTIKDRLKVLRISIEIFVGFLILFIPYLLFNQYISGAWLPNTFFAKQAEYAELKSIPFHTRLLEQALLPIVGVGAALLPGFFFTIIESIKKRKWELLAVILWILGYLAMYAWRLPVTYQHGRYVMPMMPVAFILGFSGFSKWVRRESNNNWQWIISRTWIVTVIVVLGLFWVLGVRAYSRDVAIIESEMVATSHWLNQNIPDEALLAIHDIGAVGYYTDHKLLDLAGLISPDVIPFIRDETRLKNYLDDNRANYLVTFPHWYPELTSQAELVYQTGGIIAPSMGYENMAVYRWSHP